MIGVIENVAAKHIAQKRALSWTIFKAANWWNEDCKRAIKNRKESYNRFGRGRS